MFASEPHPWGAFLEKINQDATEEMCPAQPHIVGEHACDSKFMPNLVSIFHFGPLYDHAKGIYYGK